MSKRSLRYANLLFQTSDTGMRKAKPKRRSQDTRQTHVQCECCGRGYVGFGGHWRCPWCGISNAPEDRRPKDMTCDEHTQSRKLTWEEWELRAPDRVIGLII